MSRRPVDSQRFRSVDDIQRRGGATLIPKLSSVRRRVEHFRPRVRVHLDGKQCNVARNAAKTPTHHCVAVQLVYKLDFRSKMFLLNTAD